MKDLYLVCHILQDAIYFFKMPRTYIASQTSIYLYHNLIDHNAIYFFEMNIHSSISIDIFIP